MTRTIHRRRFPVLLRTLLVAWAIASVGCDERPADQTPGATGTATLRSTDEFQASAEDLGPRDAMPGAPLYATHCATCHAGTVARAPHLSWLEMMTPAAILRSMTDGVMKPQAVQLDDQQRTDIAEYIARARVQDPGANPSAPACTGAAAAFDMTRPPSATGWGHDTARFNRASGLSAETIGQLELAWAFAYPSALRARSQPAVGMGAVFTGSHDGTVYAFDLATGCQRWTFQATAEVRTGIVLETWEGDAAPEQPLAFFGDILARLYAVDARTGDLVWSIKADDHPSATLTGTPAISGDRLYVPVSSLEVIPAADPEYECCTFRGKVLAVDTRSGDVVWRHHTIPDPPEEVGRTSAGTRVLAPSGAPVWSSPAIDLARNRLYFGTGENYSSPADENSDAIIAVDLTTGARVWQRQSTANDAWNVACMMADNPNCPPEDGPDFDHGSSMILVDTPNGQVLAAGHKNGTVFGLDPDNDGAVLWATRIGRGSIQGGVHFGMAAGNGAIFAPINDMNDTRNGDDLDPEAARPGVSAIDPASGNVMWQHVQPDVCDEDNAFCDPGISAPVTATPEAVFAGHLDGRLRAYAVESGAVLWEYDTRTPVPGTNGLQARGGGMSGAGPAVVDGYVIINSGYGLYFHEPGNALLVFRVPDGADT